LKIVSEPGTPTRAAHLESDPFEAVEV
jgi:hypothetical protein